MTTSKYRLIPFAILMIASLPLLQTLLASTAQPFLHWNDTQLTLVLMYSTPAWASAVLIFILDAFRADAMQERGTSLFRSGLRLAVLGLLTIVIALTINPVVKDLSMESLALLALISPTLGFAGGALFWQLNHHSA